MAQQELKFQKELVRSARKDQCLADIISHRFKKGWPDIIIKALLLVAVYIECKHEEARKTTPIVPVETTEIQKLCLKAMRKFGMVAFIMVKVTLDKKEHRCYPLYDLDQTQINIETHPYYEPVGREKGYLVWPTRAMIENAIKKLSESSTTEKNYECSCSIPTP